MDLVLSNSQYELYQHSERCYWWRYICGLRLAARDKNLVWGGAVHSGAERLVEVASVDDTMRFLEESGKLDGLQALAESGDYHTPGALRALLDKMAHEIDEIRETSDILGVEETVTRPVTARVGYLGKFDLVTRSHDTGRVTVHDWKTTTKRVDRSYYADNFTHNQQFTSYWWLAEDEYGDDFDGIIVNAWQTTKTIPHRNARIVLTRDDWQMEEWLRSMRTMAPRIARARERGAELLSAGLEAHDPEVVNEFPFRNTYSENFCDYRELNWSPPGVRPALIDMMYTTREEREDDRD